MSGHRRSCEDRLRPADADRHQHAIPAARVIGGGGLVGPPRACAGSIVNDAMLTFGGASRRRVFKASSTGTGSLTKTGTGTLTINGPQPLTGLFDCRAGHRRAERGHTAGSVDVAVGRGASRQRLHRRLAQPRPARSSQCRRAAFHRVDASRRTRAAPRWTAPPYLGVGGNFTALNGSRVISTSVRAPTPPSSSAAPQHQRRAIRRHGARDRQPAFDVVPRAGGAERAVGRMPDRRRPGHRGAVAEAGPQLALRHAAESQRPASTPGGPQASRSPTRSIAPSSAPPVTAVRGPRADRARRRRA